MKSQQSKPYLLELRLRGSARKYVESLAFEVSKQFGVTGVTTKRVIPHVTVLGGFNTSDERRLICSLNRMCRKYRFLKFRFNGFLSFGNWLRGNRILAIDIEPSFELSALRSLLAKELSDYCGLGKFDSKEWKPHATFAFKDIDKQFKLIRKYLENEDCPKINHYVLRLTLLKNARILCEYDFFQCRTLTRSEALSRAELRKTFEIMKETTGTL